MGDGFVPELEQQLLGAILSGGDSRAVFAMVDDHHFVEPVHQRIYALAKLAHEKYSSSNLPVVAKLVSDDLAKEFQAATGQEINGYMARCAASTVYGAGTALRAAKNVMSQWGRLRLATDTAAIAAAAQSPEADPVELVRSLGAGMDEVLAAIRKGGKGRTRQTLAEGSRAAIEASREARHKGGLTGITTGLRPHSRSG